MPGAEGAAAGASLRRVSPGKTPASSAASPRRSKYRRIDQREHVLLRPGMYVGSVRPDQQVCWLYDEERGRMTLREVRYVPGLLKIFDEILMNAIDHSVRLKEEKRRELASKREKREQQQGEGGGGGGGGGGAAGTTAAGGKTVQTMKNIRVVIDRASGAVEVANDGEGIDVAMHVEADGSSRVYIPELIFGNLLTSANYDDHDTEEDGGRIIGGQNGIGAKACNILSREFEVETVDRRRKLRYRQTFRDNMSRSEPPRIERCTSGGPMTRIRFLPDYARFGMPEGLSDDMYAMFVRRVLDATANTDADVTVHLNGKEVGCKSFERYVDLYLGPSPSSSSGGGGGGGGGGGEKDEGGGEEGRQERVYERINDWWEVVAACNADGNGMQQVSFVNGIWTMRGGTHVSHLTNQIMRRLVEAIASKRGLSKEVAGSIKPQFIRDNLFLFVKATVPNPSFSSQTKDALDTPPAAFSAPPSQQDGGGGGGRVELSRAFVDKLCRTALVQRVLALNEAVVDRGLRKTDGRKTSSVYGIPKLDDANWAGGPKSRHCTLILTEGDSAKTLAMSGLDQAARDRYGVYPLRGKVMNVCNKLAHSVMANAEIQHLKTILGLETGRQYEDAGQLRYGRIMIMTDQDVDGSHIKGLLFNLFHQMWPSLLRRVDGFFTSLLTPIVKATPRGGKGGGGGSSSGKKKGAGAAGGDKEGTLSFYNLADYRAWLESPQGGGAGGKGYDIKYYKGLGTSTRAEAKQYFRDMKVAHYRWTGPSSDDALGLAFDKGRADDRKRWLMAYDRRCGLDFGLPEVTFPDFVHKDLVHFSNYDVVRSIPSVCDGLKPSQRKILYACFKRNLVGQVKVAQLAGYVSEKAAYHHGEDSLNATIIGLAQDFVGANNVPLLQPIGQFGSRNWGGKDSSAPRYIFTSFSPLTPLLYMREDEGLLNYMDDDGFPVEPEFYVPVLPTVLINGVTGIGTGFSSDVPSYNPEDLVAVVKRCLDATDPERDVDMSDLYPWVRGFRGTIERLDKPAAAAAEDTTTDPTDNKRKVGGEGGGGGEEKEEDVDGQPPAPLQEDNASVKTTSSSSATSASKGDRFFSRGVVLRTGPAEVQVRELPIGYWTGDFKEHVDRLKLERPDLGIKAVRHNHTDISVLTVLTFVSPAALDALLEAVPATAARPEMTLLEKELKLVATRNLSTCNMHLYNAEGRVQRYRRVKDVVLDHFRLRLEAYAKRKVLLLRGMRAREGLLSDKIRFLQLVIDGEVVVHKRSKAELEQQLAQLGFPSRAASAAEGGGSGSDDTNDTAGEEGTGNKAAGGGEKGGGYDHLIKMPIFSLTLDKKREAEAQLSDLRLTIARTEATEERDMWRRDLDAFQEAYRRWLVESAPDEEDVAPPPPSAQKITPLPSTVIPEKATAATSTSLLESGSSKKEKEKTTTATTTTAAARSGQQQQQQGGKRGAKAAAAATPSSARGCGRGGGASGRGRSSGGSGSGIAKARGGKGRGGGGRSGRGAGRGGKK